MILFINGSFGVGKTTVAELLIKQIPNSLLFDAEEVGYFIRNVVAPIERPDDFQHLPMWRSLTIATARQLIEIYGRTLIMPMTIWRKEYFDEILGSLRAFEPKLMHFCLTASKEVLFQRLENRGDRPDVFAWCSAQAEHSMTAFKDPSYAEHINTDCKTPEEIAAEILSRLQIQISSKLVSEHKA